MNSTAISTELILSASLSGISKPNSSSSAITISTVSKLSSPRSFWKCALGVTFASFATLNKPSLHIPSTSNRIGTLGRINFLEVLDNVKDTIGDLRLVEKGASDFIGEIATEEVVERGG
uniref:Uncharacterized protein n=1 Tax=Opuntia streptacantha TaxID=393608 RepID=A0A7C9DX54_OPUST